MLLPLCSSGKEQESVNFFRISFPRQCKPIRQLRRSGIISDIHSLMWSNICTSSDGKKNLRGPVWMGTNLCHHTALSSSSNINTTASLTGTTYHRGPVAKCRPRRFDAHSVYRCQPWTNKLLICSVSSCQLSLLPSAGTEMSNRSASYGVGFPTRFPKPQNPSNPDIYQPRKTGFNMVWNPVFQS